MLPQDMESYTDLLNSIDINLGITYFKDRLNSRINL
jgi:hypothetical protein